MIGKVFVLGERPGLGQTMKLVNNVLSATAMAATSEEAMVTGVKAGLDPRLMLEVINAGTGRNTATEDKFTKAILPGTFDLGFAAALMLKDIKLFLAERQALGVPTDVIEAVARLFQIACDECGPDADLSARSCSRSSSALVSKCGRLEGEPDNRHNLKRLFAKYACLVKWLHETTFSVMQVTSAPARAQ